MRRAWTEERRRKQAEAIRKHKPWEKSTGPRTARGKARSSQNAYKHGLRSASAVAVRAMLFHNKEFLKSVYNFCALKELTNEVLKNRTKSGL